MSQSKGGKQHRKGDNPYLVEYVSEPVHGQRFGVVDSIRLSQGHEHDANGIQPADGARRAHSLVMHVHTQAVQHLPGVVGARSLRTRYQ